MVLIRKNNLINAGVSVNGLNDDYFTDGCFKVIVFKIKYFNPLTVLGISLLASASELESLSKTFKTVPINAGRLRIGSAATTFQPMLVQPEWQV